MIFFLSPWLSWQGLPLIHLDLVNKEFRFAEVIFWPEDLMILTWMMVAGAFALFFIAMAAGRLWCGFTCPQTVWTFLFLRLEQVFEGSRHKRLKMDRTPWQLNTLSLERGLRKLLKHLSWLSLSLLTGLSFIAYFYPMNHMADDLVSGSLSGMGIFWILFIASFTYLNAGFLREQVCTHMCPYSRFQSVMADAATVTVHYDSTRNDCIDCDVCVQVCPTDIDIRDGLQLACIACGACVDGCNDIMTKVNKPTGLISFRPESASPKQAMNLLKRPRLIGYACAFIIACGLILAEWQQREVIHISLERDRHTLYQINMSDEVENHYQLKLHNKSQQQQTFQLKLTGDNQYESHYQISPRTFTLSPRQRLEDAITITQITLGEDANVPSSKQALQLDLVSMTAQNQVLSQIETVFIAPRFIAPR
jgi:polyferredoxin